MNKTRFPFTKTKRPKENDVVMLCVDSKGIILCGVVDYEQDITGKDIISVMMFVNDRETEAWVSLDDIRWWSYLPITKKELWHNGGKL